MENLLHVLRIDGWRVDRVLLDLVNQIRKDDAKKETVSKYIARYAETFKRWDSNSEEENRSRQNDQSLINAYQNLSDTKLPLYAKYNSVIRLSNNLDFIRKKEPKPLVNVIETFLDNLDLDKMILEKKENNSFSISKPLVIIPYFVRILHHLDFVDHLKRHRMVLAKTLPIVCCTTNFDSREIRNIYKSVIGNLDEKEINELIMTEDCIELTCHLQYCENCQSDPASLLSVLGCNIYDKHDFESAVNPSCEEHPQTQTM